MFLGQTSEVGKKFQKFIKKINQNILKKKMFTIDLGEDMLIYLQEKIF